MSCRNSCFFKVDLTACSHGSHLLVLVAFQQFLKMFYIEITLSTKLGHWYQWFVFFLYQFGLETLVSLQPFKRNEILVWIFSVVLFYFFNFTKFGFLLFPSSCLHWVHFAFLKWVKKIKEYFLIHENFRFRVHKIQ